MSSAEVSYAIRSENGYWLHVTLGNFSQLWALCRGERTVFNDKPAALAALWKARADVEHGMFSHLNLGKLRLVRTTVRPKVAADPVNNRSYIGCAPSHAFINVTLPDGKALSVSVYKHDTAHIIGVNILTVWAYELARTQ